MLNVSMPTTDLEEQVEAFLDTFDAFAQAVRRARGARSPARPDALTLSQYGLIEPLLESRGARVQELAAQAGVSAPTATRILDTLERRAMIVRDRAHRDRRAVRVQLTSAGRAALAAQHEWLRGRERSMFEELSAGERALAPHLLARLATLVDELAIGPL
jgi:DNA-binding MarR family transcriptional regulator